MLCGRGEAGGSSTNGRTPVGGGELVSPELISTKGSAPAVSPELNSAELGGLISPELNSDDGGTVGVGSVCASRLNGFTDERVFISSSFSNSPPKAASSVYPAVFTKLSCARKASSRLPKTKLTCTIGEPVVTLTKPSSDLGNSILS